MAGPVVAFLRMAVIEIDVTRLHTVPYMTFAFWRLLPGWKSHQRKLLRKMATQIGTPF
jgi:hypothetical protein